MQAVEALAKDAQDRKDFATAATCFRWLAAVNCPESFGPATPTLEVVVGWAVQMDSDTLTEWLLALFTGTAPLPADRETT